MVLNLKFPRFSSIFNLSTQGPDEVSQVTVLIGIAWKGRAVAGVVNQPFYKLEEPEGYRGRCIWGIEGHGTAQAQAHILMNLEIYINITFK